MIALFLSCALAMPPSSFGGHGFFVEFHEYEKLPKDVALRIEWFGKTVYEKRIGESA